MAIYYTPLDEINRVQATGLLFNTVFDEFDTVIANIIDGGQPLTVDINGGAIDGTIIGANSAAAGTFTMININGNSGTVREMIFKSNNSFRFAIGIGSGAESGGGVGSDWFINRFDDSGVFVDTPFLINRASGHVEIANLKLTAAYSAGTSTQSGTVPINIGGTTYHIMVSGSAAT